MMRKKALALVPRMVATAPAIPSARLRALQEMADYLRQCVSSGRLNPAIVTDKIFEVAELHGLTGGPGSDKEATIMQIAMSANLQAETSPTVRFDSRSNCHDMPAAPSLETKRQSLQGDRATPKRWLAAARIPNGDLTLYSGNGGAGKTETAVQLLVAVSGLISERDFESVVPAFRELHDCFSVQRLAIVALIDAQRNSRNSFTSENEVNSSIFILGDG
jgi:hypothetical protein